MSDTLPPPEKPMADITKQLASALRLYLSAYQAMDQAAAIRAADRAAHESLAALASQPAARVALTWDQFVAACEAEYGEDFAPEEFVDVPEDQKEELMRVVRMVERAHGISEYALAARQQAQVPEGFVLVPVEPTPEMKTAGLNVEVYQDSPPEPESLTWAEVRAIYRAMLSAAPRPEAVAGWQPISTAPKDGRKMLLFYLNANGQARRVIGGWVTAEEAAETDADDVGLEAGWYERIDNWPDYYQVAINEGEPTHWMPLPAAPQEPTHG